MLTLPYTLTSIEFININKSRTLRAVGACFRIDHLIYARQYTRRNFGRVSDSLVGIPESVDGSTGGFPVSDSSLQSEEDS